MEIIKSMNKKDNFFLEQFFNFVKISENEFKKWKLIFY